MNNIINELVSSAMSIAYPEEDSKSKEDYHKVNEAAFRDSFTKILKFTRQNGSANKKQRVILTISGTKKEESYEFFLEHIYGKELIFPFGRTIVKILLKPNKRK